jgi:hypothetical protein
MNDRDRTLRLNLNLARGIWGNLTRSARYGLRELTNRYNVSVALGEIQLIDGRWFLTHAGLLRIAQRKHCCGIDSVLVERLSDPIVGRWVFRARVKCSRLRAFVAYGDADPSNCSTLVHGAEMRVAETRAVNRALRKAYGIGLCSVEELGSISNPPKPAPAGNSSYNVRVQNGSDNGQPRLRDQLCLLVRKFNLDPSLVKAYAADFCGTETLSGASRDLVESFISHLSASATQNRDALVCKLNSYSRPQEATL